MGRRLEGYHGPHRNDPGERRSRRDIDIRETHLGPVASEFCFRQEGDPEIALKRVPMCETNRETVQGVFAMMRAENAVDFARAATDWRFPSANCVFGDADGHIGYTTLGAIPIRPRDAPDREGNQALPGAGSAHDWTGFVPADLLPALRDPTAGFIFSANHRPVGAFYPLPLGLSTFFRFVATPLALTFGGGESGLARFLKDAARRIAADPKTTFGSDEAEFMDRVLADAWREHAGASSGREVGRERSRGVLAGEQRLAWFDTLDGFGSLAPSEDIAVPGITCLDGQTIRSQAGQSYTQWVPLHNVDEAQSVCPIGHSDRPDSPWRTSTMSLWEEGRLHPAPLGRAAVEKIAGTRRVWADPTSH